MATVIADQTPRLTSLSPGAGCACKLPLAKLEAMFASMDPGAPAHGDLLIGAAEADDAAVLRLDDERALVLTTDFFTPIVDDPGDWGRIAAANALSDVYAMGGRPLFAVNLAAWPGDGLDIALLGQVLQGGAQVAAEAGCVIAGGHTIDDPVPKYGLAVVGLAHPDRLMTIDRAAPGDQLILTKPVGTGVIATALKRGAPPPEVVKAAVASMTALNAEASQAALAAGVTAATDVTGFGLLGHLHRMLAASGAAATVTAAAVPLLPGAAGPGRRGLRLRRHPRQHRPHQPLHEPRPRRPRRPGHPALRRPDLRRPPPGHPGRQHRDPPRRPPGPRPARRPDRRGRQRGARSHRRAPLTAFPPIR